MILLTFNGHTARWAVFFDSMDIEYHYEPEGYELKDRRYLPGFWIPSWNSFIEIKGALAESRKAKSK